ncbi:hypothetical protein FA13DRAFT_575154 [Coprinellus micaceus]|uniref:Uncharacterized protein n=1 Tax=Coprinellus micaceus TaxID=71717 RepID=A0A4Y7T7N2_COPMI|nr:hypothetical protein FA13DRAFT_575154 [Coprinellus micaceus]
MNKSQGNEALGMGLSKLPKIDKSSFMASYVKQQQRNTNVYEVEGRRYLQTWGKDDRKSGSSAVGLGTSEALERDVKRKAKEKERGNGRTRAGIETPVLKPRNPELRGREVVPEKSRSRTGGKENRVPDEARKEAGALKAGEGKGKETKKASSSKEMAWVKSVKASKDGESDSGNDTEAKDREQSKRHFKPRSDSLTPIHKG